MQSKIAPFVKEVQPRGNAQKIGPKIMKVHEGNREALPTDSQKKQWNEMLGNPLDL